MATAASVATAENLPIVKITAPPSASFLPGTAARVQFRSSGPTSCALDGAGAMPCANGSATYSGLAPGPHVVTVSTSDQRGAAAAAVVVVVPAVGDLTEWKPAFADDFDTSTLDKQNWSAQRRGGSAAPFNPDREDAAYDAGQVSEHNGVLELTLRQAAKRVGGVTYPNRSGIVETAGRQDFMPPAGGALYIRARIRVPTCGGCWPAFWLEPADGSWPPELDIFEFFNAATQSRPRFNLHWGKWPHTSQSGPTAYGLSDIDYTGGWHTYELYWSAKRVQAFVDGVPGPAETSAEAIPAQPMYLILNLAHKRGAALDGRPSMLVDYVKAWTFVGNG